MQDKSKNIRVLINAILEKKCAAVYWEGHTRLVAIEPHVIYTDYKDDVVLEFYQRSGDKNVDGAWDTVGWRDIKAAFILNSTFSPRLNEGFDPKLDKYQAGLLAMVSNSFSSKSHRSLWKKVETTIDEIVRKDRFDQFANR